MNKQSVCLIAMLAIASLLAATTAGAATPYFQGTPPDCNWSTPTNWSTGAVPASGDTVYIDNGQTAVLDVNYSGYRLYLGTTTNFGGMNISHDLALTSRFIVGTTGFGTSTVTQTAGTLSGARLFYLGARDGTDPTTVNTTGIYYLQGGVINVSNTCNIGHRGTGKMYQTGGELNQTSTASSVAIGSTDWGNSCLSDISAGKLTALSTIEIGTGQTGTLRVSGTALVDTVNMQMGRTSAPIRGPYSATVDQEGGTVEADSIVTNYGFSTCNYNLSGGTLRLTSSAASTVGGLHLLPGTSGLGGTIEAAPDVTPLPTLTSNVDYDMQAGTVKVPLAGDGIKLNKTGEGLVTLTAANTYTGDTTVSAGTLRLDGSVTSNVSVAAAGKLMGGGTVTGGLASATGGVVAPGASIGTITVTGNATLGGTLDVEFDDLEETIDMLAVSGTLDIDAATVDFADLNGGSQELELPYYVFASYGTLGGTGTFANVVNLPTGYQIDYSYGENNNQIALVVPEPSTILLIVAGLTLVVWKRRS